MVSATAAEPAVSKDPAEVGAKAAEHSAVVHFVSQQHETHGAVNIGGRHFDYNAYAGTLVVHPKGWDDVPQNAAKDEDKNPPPEASMFYVAYMRGPATASSVKAAAGEVQSRPRARSKRMPRDR